MTPVEKVISEFGGVNATARILKISKSAVSRWQRRVLGDQVGLIPVKYHREILAYAKKNKKNIKVSDLVRDY